MEYENENGYRLGDAVKGGPSGGEGLIVVGTISGWNDRCSMRLKGSILIRYKCCFAERETLWNFSEELTIVGDLAYGNICL